jgi:hypothetical protein
MAASLPDQPALAEDILLLLFGPRTGAIAGDGMALFHTLAGAVLVDLADQERVAIAERQTWHGQPVCALGASPPVDPLLRGTWERVAAKPVDVQSLILEIGPGLRESVLERLIRRGHLHREHRRFLGVVPYAVLRDGGTSRRAELLAVVRTALVDGADPDARTATLAALLSASGVLAWLAAEIPWSGAVYTRGKALEGGEWGAAAAAEAVRRTTVALIASEVALSTQLAATR